jgi:(2Fe-2S) ferredoxin
VGQYARHIFVCTHGEYCPLQGSVEVVRILREGIASNGLKGSVRVNKAGCFSQCGNGPMVVVYPDDVWYGGVSVDKARRVLNEHLIGGRPVEEARYRMPPGPNRNSRRMAELRSSGYAGAGSPERS